MIRFMRHELQLSLLHAIVAWLSMLLRTRAGLQLYDFALRQPLAVLKQERPRPAKEKRGGLPIQESIVSRESRGISNLAATEWSCEWRLAADGKRELPAGLIVELFPELCESRVQTLIGMTS